MNKKIYCNFLIISLQNLHLMAKAPLHITCGGFYEYLVKYTV